MKMPKGYGLSFRRKPLRNQVFAIKKPCWKLSLMAGSMERSNASMILNSCSDIHPEDAIASGLEVIVNELSDYLQKAG